jgi:outer membrane usher protein
LAWLGAVGVLLSASIGVAAASEPAAAVASDAVEEFFLAVSINGQIPDGMVLIARTADRRLLARREDLLRWRLLVPESGSILVDGEQFYPLDALPGLVYHIDEPRQVLLMDAPTELFSGTRIDVSRGQLTEATPSPLGGFFNYDVFATSGSDRTAINALAEVGVFNAWGVGTSNFLRQDLPEGARTVRLGTSLIRDFPEKMTSLRIGDLVSGGGSWGRSVRFGGVQWATNFASQPGLITFPRPAMAGEAVLPSTLELYVNDTLRMRRQVPAGPFAIEDMPVLTGQGEARLVVTDLLGREQTIVAPYFASPQLLKQGLNAYSYEIGAIREDFGIASSNYGRALAVGTFRRGFADGFTGEIRAELLENQQTVGVGGVFLLPAAGVFNVSMAASESDPARSAGPAGMTSTPGGAGGQLGLAFQGQHRRLGYGAIVQLASEGFAQVGLEPGRPAPRVTAQAHFNVAMYAAGSFGLSYAYQERRDAGLTELLSASYSVTLGSIGFLSLSALHVFGTDPDTTFGFNFTRLFGRRDTAGLSAARDADSTRGYVRMQRSLPAGDGIGYRVSQGLADADRRDAAVSLQSDVGTYSAEVGQVGGVTSYRGSASGGVAMLGADAFLSRRIDNSFAVVRVPGYAGVNIYQDNQPIARTNEHGTALISRLRPYEANSVRIEQADLPLDTQIKSVQLDAIPYLRSGLLLSFLVKRSRGAVYVVVLDSGEPLPAGAVARVVGHAEEFPVGLRGEVYMTDLEAANQIVVTWREQRCEFALAFPESSDPLPDLGTHTCSGVVQ